MRKICSQVIPVVEELGRMWTGVCESIVAAQNAVHAIIVPRRNRGQGGAMDMQHYNGWQTQMAERHDQLSKVEHALSSLSLSVAAFLVVLDEMRVLPPNLDVSMVVDVAREA
eukprot:3523942-Amphidinium_carterae.1